MSKCPSCNEEIASTYESDAISMYCPHCSIRLEVTVIEEVAHDYSEIDPNTERTAALGVLCARFVPQDMVGCYCGQTYPKSFSCCPSLLSMAVGIPLYLDEQAAFASINYIESNLETFKLCLVSDFSDLFTPQSLQQFYNDFKNLMSDSLRETLTRYTT